MQKRSLIIFSFLVVSILLIAGCQDTVGGRFSPRKSVPSFPAYTDSVRVNDNVNVAVPNSFANYEDYATETIVTTCPGITIGAPVELRDNEGYPVGCYQIIDCVSGTYNSNPYNSERGVHDYTIPIYLPVVKFIDQTSQFCQGAQKMSVDWVVMDFGL